MNKRKNLTVRPALILVLVLVMLMSVLVVGCDFNEPVLVGTTPSQSGSSSTGSKNDKATFNVGETAALKDIEVSFVGVTESTGSTYNKPSDGNVYVLCEFNIVNNSDEEIVVSSLMSFEAYCDDYTCSYSLGALMEKGNKNQLDGTVAAGKKLSGVIGYEVPADWKELEITFTPDVWSGKEIVFFAKNN